MSRLILVSNRLPVQIRTVKGKPSVTRSSGGLVAGLGPVHDQGGLWAGTLGTTREAELERELAEQRLAVVPLREKDAKQHYEGYSNSVLWPLFHYLLEHVAFDSSHFDSYARVNEAFADAIAGLAGAEDEIWVHDYHLMLLPGLLRQRLPNAKIGFFLHIPFPSSEVFRTLPRKEEILRGLLGANLIGLHTYDYARHLVSSFRRVLGVEFDERWVRSPDGRCRVGVYPLGVDAATFRELSDSHRVQEKAERFRDQAQGRRIVLGVDRMDYTKGVPLRLRAFKRLLERDRNWTRRVMLWQLAVPSRSDIASYQSLKEEVDRLVGEINGDHEIDGLVPIHYLYRSVQQEDLVAMYRAADVAFVTPTRDGMNLVAKEYVASRTWDSGVLVLSEFAGAAAEMGEALLHNPYDIDGTADVLERALTLPVEEERRRMAGLRHRVHQSTVHRWVRRFLADFRASTVGESSPGEHEEPGTWVPELVRAVAYADRAVIALDYDGTLTELFPRPEQARPSESLRALIDSLARYTSLDVVVISGRDGDTLEAWLGDLPIHLVAEHGLRWRHAQARQWNDLIDDLNLEWRDAVREVLVDYASRVPGAHVEVKHAAIVWHYREVEPAFGEWQARELHQHLSEGFAGQPVEVTKGSKIVEVKAQGYDKGRAFQRVSRELGPFTVEMAAGDDRTDEDLFAVLAHSPWTIKVGQGPTRARHRVRSPQDIRRILVRLSEELGGRGS